MKISQLLCGLSIMSSCYLCAFEESTAEDQRGLSLTLYGAQFAQVDETRKVDLESHGTLIIHDIPTQLIPESVVLREGKGVSITQQRYSQGLLNRSSLLKHFEGQTIGLLDENEEKKEIRLLRGSDEIVELDGELYVGAPGQLVFPYWPKELKLKPRLTWDYQAERTGKQTLGMTYLTRGLSWQTDFQWILSSARDCVEMESWVTLQNQSGTSFEEAKVSLVAGDLSLPVQGHDYKIAHRAAYQEASPVSQVQSFSDYYLYPIEDKVSIRNNEQVQLPFGKFSKVAARVHYLVEATLNLYGRWSGEQNLAVKSQVSVDSGWNKALPGGRVWVYERSIDGDLLLSGSSRVPHLSAGEPVTVTIGSAFDLEAKRKQLSYKKVDRDTTQTQWETTVQNRKEYGVDIVVQETLSGSWKILSSSHSYKKIDASHVEFALSMEADSQEQIHFLVEMDMR